MNPAGDESFPSVKKGNLITARTLLLLYVAAALQAWRVLEQPKGSIMENIPCFRQFTKNIKTFRYHICMQQYGGPTLKPTWLYSGYSYHPKEFFVQLFFWGFECKLQLKGSRLQTPKVYKDITLEWFFKIIPKDNFPWWCYGTKCFRCL